MNRKSVQVFKEQKVNILRIIVFSVLLAIAINIFTNGIINTLDLSDKGCVIIGIILIVLIIFISCMKITKNMKSVILFKGAMVIEKENNEFCEIKKYPIVEDMDNFLYSAQNECIFRKNCASVPEERSAIPLETEQCSVS